MWARRRWARKLAIWASRPDSAGTSSSYEWVGTCLLIERFRGQIDTIRPYHGARLSVDPDLGEVLGIVERFQEACPVLSREVHVADGPVAEQEPEHMLTEHGNTNHGRKVLLAHSAYLTAGVLCRAEARSSWLSPSSPGSPHSGAQPTP